MPALPEAGDGGICERFAPGASLDAARSAMRDLAKAFRPEQLLKNAFSLYEEFRPAIPEGMTGWGAKGKLDIDRIRSLALKK